MTPLLKHNVKIVVFYFEEKFNFDANSGKTQSLNTENKTGKSFLSRLAPKKSSTVSARCSCDRTSAYPKHQKFILKKHTHISLTATMPAPPATGLIFPLPKSSLGR